MGLRRKSREATLQILYQVDLSQGDAKELCAAYWQQHELESEAKEFAENLVNGVLRNLKEIDHLIESHSTHWKISRMSCVDRNILRIAVFELLYQSDIPASVSLNEAIEIGKKFGTEDSGAFINGILDHIAKELKKD